MAYITVQKTAEKWGIAVRQVQNLCKAGKIPDVVRFGREWAIPENAKKPPDGRRRIVDPDCAIPVSISSSAHAGSFQNFIRHCPYPVHIAAIDGSLIMANEAFYTFFQVPAHDALYKNYNILLDPYLEKWEIKEYIQKAFRGEVIELTGIKVPVQDLIRRFSNAELSEKEIYQNITSFPVFSNTNTLECVVTIFFGSRIYTGRDTIRKSKAYIDTHWLEKFDIEKIASSVFLSKYYFTRLFKQETGITPYHYYQDVKIQKLQGKLCDQDKSIVQAFNECGLDYSGYYSKLFREKVGVTPSQYRASIHG